MADEVAAKANALWTGVEGAAYIAPNGLKIPPTHADIQKVSPDITTPLNDASLSGQYVDRFDDISYYS